MTESLLSVIMGFLGTWLIQVIKTYSGQNGNRALLITLVISMTLGAGVSYITGAFEGNSLAKDMSIVFTSATFAYNFLVKYSPKAV